MWSQNKIKFHIAVVLWFQEKDLKQYMDDCGNIMSMTNVKVSTVYL